MYSSRQLDLITKWIDRIAPVIWGCSANTKLELTGLLGDEVIEFTFKYPETIKLLDTELRQALQTRTESKLQDRHCRMVVEVVIEKWIPIYRFTINARIAAQNEQWEEFTVENGLPIRAKERVMPDEEYQTLRRNQDILARLDNALIACIKLVVRRINQFAPELYESNQATLGEFLDSTTANAQQIPTEPGVKLTWNGDKKVLINVFRQLRTSYTKDRKPLINEGYEEIALFIMQHFVGFDKNKLSTIRGQLTKTLDDPKGLYIPLNLTEPE